MLGAELYKGEFMMKYPKIAVRSVFLAMSLVLSSADAFESAFPFVNVAGDFNGWNAGQENLTLVADNVWQGDILIADLEFGFKFTPGNLSQSWGMNVQPHTVLPQSGQAALVPGNIQVNNTTGRDVIRFTFNDETLQFSVQPINYIGSNVLFNGSFEVQGSEQDQARYWQQGQPNTRGGVFGGTARGSWLSPPPSIPDGEWFAAILGNWSGSTSGTWWQEAPVEPRQSYEASAWFYAEGVPNQWTADQQGMRLEFYDFNGNLLDADEEVDLSGVTDDWQIQTVSAVAPRRAAWGRVVIYAAGTGPSGTFLIDDVQLRAVASNRTQNFDDWPGGTQLGNYIFEGWGINNGQIVTSVVDGAFTTQLARSGQAVSLANATGDPADGGAVVSPRLDSGVGVISFYYRHGFTGDPEEGAEDPVSLVVETSVDGLFYDVVSEINNIFTLEHVRHNVPLLEELSRFVRIRHTGSSTNRLILDDIEIALPEQLGFARFMNFDEWPAIGETLGCHDFDGWRICTGLVSSAFAKSGLSAQIFGDDGDGNYLRSPQYPDGYGPISFSYRRGTNGINTVGFVLEASPDGDNWTELDRVEDIFETSWIDYSRFFFEDTPHYVRIRNIQMTEESESGAVLLFEPFDGGSQAPPGWSFTSIGQYNSNASSGDSGPPSLSFNRDTSVVITPDVANPTNIQFMIRGNSTGGDSTFFVEGWQGGQWVNIDTITSFPTVVGGGVLSYPVSTNMTRFRFRYDKDLGNVAFDDLLITGLPPEDDGEPQILMLDDVLIAAPVEFRTQTFDTWPTKGSYAGDSEHQFWRLTGDNIVDGNNAFEGQVARLRRPSAGPNPTIWSHFLRDGIGTIDFVYRAWPNDQGVGFQVQLSEDGESWTTADTVTDVLNTEYAEYSLFVNSPTAHYMRITQHAGANNARLLVDNINLRRPTPPPAVLLSGGIDPERPYTNDTVEVFAQTIAQNGARDIIVTAHYRVGDTGPFTELLMQKLDGEWRTVDSIPAQTSETVVEYYLRAVFNGPGGQSGEVFFPATAPAEPASYEIPRNRPGSVWINEIDYIGDFFAPDTFIELAGEAELDLTDYSIVIRDVTPDQGVRGHYVIPDNWTIPDTVNGFGFFVLADNAIPAPPRDMLLTNTLIELTAGFSVTLYNEIGQVENALAIDSFIPGNFERLFVQDQDEDIFAPSEYSVGLIGTGGEYSDFEWGEFIAPTPGAANPGQVFGEPAVIGANATEFGFEYIRNSFAPEPQTLVITNAGMAELTYTLATNRTWLSVSPGGGTLQPGETLSHSISVDTTGRAGNLSGNITVVGGAVNSPFDIVVSLVEVPIPNSLLRYSFDQGSGALALNAGLAGPDGHLTLAGGATWTLSAGGVSGAGGDFAVNVGAATSRLHTASAVTGLNNVSEFSLAGWFRTTGSGDDRLLIGNRASGNGFDLRITSNYTRFALTSADGSEVAPVLSDAGTFNTNDWVFFAVTFDSADEANAVRFYTGSLSNDVALLSSHARADLAATGISTNRLYVGGDGAASLNAHIDDFRVFTNSMDVMVLQAVRNISVERRAGAGEFQAPLITEQPLSQTVNIDQPVSFSVVATGDPEPTYQWRRNGVNITLIENNTAENPDFFISNVQPTQMGEYTVVVENQFGSVTSSVANLFVNHPPAILESPADQYVYLGTVVQLSVEHTGYPPPTYRWRRDQTVLGPTVANWSFTASNLAQTGGYSVTVSNQFGVATSQVATIRIQDPGNLGQDGGFMRPGPDNRVVIGWASGEGRTFDILYSPNIMDGEGSFVPIVTNLPATPPMNVYTTDVIYGTDREGFFRFRSHSDE